MPRRLAVRVEAMEPADWPVVRRIYAEGIATGNATLEREAPDWDHFDRSHRPDCRLVARSSPGGEPLGWTALTAYSARRAYVGVAWESVYVARNLVVAAWDGRSSRRSSRHPRRPGSGRSWPASWPRTRRASPSTNAPASARSASSWPVGRDGFGRWRDVVMMERRSRTVGT